MKGDLKEATEFVDQWTKKPVEVVETLRNLRNTAVAVSPVYDISDLHG
jgi:hypothetical protein